MGGRGRGTERQQNTRHSPQTLPRQPSSRPKRQKSNRKQNQAAEDEDIYYKGQFVLVERTSFEAFVKQARVQDMNEPVKPEPLRNLDFLCVKKPSEGFDLPGCGTEGTISPFPPAQPSPADPELLDLNAPKPEKPKLEQVQKKGKKAQKGKKKNQKKKK